MKKLILLAVILLATFVNAKTPNEIKKPVLPYYKLPVGKKLIYTTTNETKGTKMSYGSKTQTQFWVYERNADSSYRIIVNQNISSYQMQDTIQKESEPQIIWAYFDIFANGIIKDNVSLSNFDPTAYFIPLPTDTLIANSGWERFDSSSQERTHYLVENKNLSDNVWTIQINKETPFDSIYLVSTKSLAYLDLKQGLMTKKEIEVNRGYGYGAGKTTGLVTLDSIKLFDTVGFKPFVNELISYFQAESVYNKILEKVEYNSPDMNSLMASAKNVLDEVLTNAKDSIIKSMLNEDLASHEQLKTSLTDDSLWFAKTINKKAADWKLKDLSEKFRTLKEYRGKIVILDFWYRGCPWCIRAMPMINQIAKDFSISPVAVLGMNIDKDKNDALFVIDKMKLVYPSLQAGDTYKKYGVTGFPTLFVIDKKGIIRDIHIGYSPDLGLKVSNKITSLLKTK